MIGFYHKKLRCQSVFDVNEVQTLDLIIKC